MINLIYIVDNLIRIYELLVIIRCVITWFPIDANNPIIRVIIQITEPLMDAVRKAFPFLMAGGLDLSPILILFLLDVTRRYLLSVMLRLIM